MNCYTGSCSASQPAEGARILVVDDDPELLALLQALLEAHGFAVSTASDGASALQVYLPLVGKFSTAILFHAGSRPAGNR